MDRETTLTNKEKIILIINESLKFGRLTKFTYSVMLEEHRRLCDVVLLKDTIIEKTKLFNNLDEKSELYKSIYSTAKMALVTIQKEQRYNFNSAELLLKIFNLEDIFSRKLKSQGSKIVDLSERKKKQVIIEEADEEVTKTEKQLREIFIGKETSGRKLNTQIKKEKDIRQSLQQNSL